MAEDIYLQMQKLANDTQIKLQDMSDKTTAKTFAFNREESKKARDWQKMMSDTSHQREVKDLKKAGLNPVLSVNQGAQSYTTSSASGQAENAASAVGQIMASQMSGMAGVKESEIHAAATRNAAATTAAAQRAAAAQAAAAQRYAADMAYRTQQEKNAADYARAEMQAKWQYRTQIDKPVSSIGGFLDKVATKFGAYDIVGSSRWLSGLKNFAQTALNDPMKFFNNIGKSINKWNFSLNKSGVNYVNQRLFTMGINPSQYTRNLVVKGFVFQDENAARQVVNLARESYYRHLQYSHRRYQGNGKFVRW